MAARTPAPPRIATPEVPAQLDRVDALAPRADLIGVQVSTLAGDISAAHARLAESRIDGASVGRLDVTGAVFTDVQITGLRAVTLVARDGSWRGVEIADGRIGTIDAHRASWDSVALRGLRIDYLSLTSAEVADMIVIDCLIGTLDVPDARLTRVRFEGSRADEVDTRGLRAADLDLRGLDALSFTDPRALSGATMTGPQAELHAAAWASALGVWVVE